MNTTPKNLATTELLTGAVRTLGRLAQQGANEVDALARMALVWLETPEGCRDLEVVAAALQSISATAQRMEDSVDTALHTVHCGHDDPAQMRRQEARSLALLR